MDVNVHPYLQRVRAAVRYARPAGHFGEPWSSESLERLLTPGELDRVRRHYD